MQGDQLRIGLVAMHTSPLETPGRGDAGGMNVQVRALADGLARQGHTVDVYTRRSAPGLPECVTLDSGARVHHITAGPVGTVAKNALPGVLEEFTAGLASFPAPDLWHSHYWLSGAAVVPLVGPDGPPHLVNLHTIAPQKHAHRAQGDPGEAEVREYWECRLAHVATLLTGSRYERSMILRHYDARGRTVHVVRPGVDTALFNPSKARHPGPCGGSPYLLTLGRVQPFKGQDLALDSYIEMLHLRPHTPHHMVIAGEPTPGAETFAASLAERARTAGVGDRVHFLPAQQRDAAAALLAGATLTLVPSRSETYGLVALESAACGTPVMAQRVGGLIDSIRHGESGMLMRGRDPRKWGADLAELLTDTTRLDRLATSAREFALRNSWGRYLERLERLYRRSLRPPVAEILPTRRLAGTRAASTSPGRPATPPRNTQSAAAPPADHRSAAR